MTFFNLHTHHYTQNPNILELVNQYPQEFDATIPFYSIGIHPWYLVENRVEADLEIIEKKLQEPNCLALGECGLDKRIEIPMDLQQQVFEKQLVLAQKYNKPVVIHCVAAFDELIAVTKKLKISVPIIIHGFSKNVQVAKQLLGNGFYLSFGKYLLQNPDLETVFRTIPNDKFFLETDIMALSLEQVYDLAAKQKEISVDEIQKQINTNFVSVFKSEI
jgi:TatD DNase family protein